MIVNKIECLVDAIGRLNGIHNPDSVCYALRNPLMIRSFARPGKHETDAEGRRIFTSMLSGYKAGLFDLELKLRGKSRAGLKATDTLDALLAIYGFKEKAAIDNVVSFVRRGLKDQAIGAKTPLAYFLDGLK